MGHWLLITVFAIECVAWHWLLVRLVSHDRGLGRVEGWAAALTFQVAAWTLTLTALGFFGWMFAPVTLCIMGLGWFASALGFYSRQDAVPFHRVLPAHSAAEANGIRLQFSRAVSLGGAVREFLHLPPPSTSLLTAGAFCVVAILCALVYLGLGARLPVVDYDGLSYHLSTAVHMAQDGDFRYYPGESGYVNHFARGGELLMALAIQLVGSLRFVNAVQWIMLPVIFFAVYGAVRGFGGRRASALVAASLPVVSPVILHQSKMAYADLFSAGWFAVGVCAVVGAATRRVSPVRVLWMFVAAGLCVSTKHNGAPLALLMGVSALVAWGPAVLLKPHKRTLTITAAAFGLSLLIGLPWMARNLVNWGSPLFPFAVEVGERTIFPGDFPMEATKWMASDPGRPDLSEIEKLWVTFTNLDLESRERAGWFGGNISKFNKQELLDESWGMRGDRKDTGFGAVWLLAGLPCLLILPLTTSRRFAVTLTLSTIVALWITTSPWWARFALYIVPMGAIAVGVVLSAVEHKCTNRDSEIRAATSPVFYFSIFILSIPFLFDATSVLFLNRDFERLERYRVDTDASSLAPVDWMLWTDPQNPMWRAVGDLVHGAKSGDTISVFSPEVVIFNGALVDSSAQVKNFPFPSVYPFPKDFPPNRVMELLEENEVTRFLTGPRINPVVMDELREDGWSVSTNHQEFIVWEL